MQTNKEHFLPGVEFAVGRYLTTRRELLFDPQTSGGLLLSVGASSADAVFASSSKGRNFRQFCRHRRCFQRPKTQNRVTAQTREPNRTKHLGTRGTFGTPGTLGERDRFNCLLTPDITVLWVVGFLLLCTYLLNTLVFQPILRVIDQRAGAVRGARELADSAAQKATAAAAEYDQKLNTARAEVYGQMDDMRKAALDKRAEVLASTRATVEQELTTASARVQQESKEARAALDRDASNLAGAIVSRVLGRAS